MEIKSPLGLKTPKVQEPYTPVTLSFPIHHSSGETITALQPYIFARFPSSSCGRRTTSIHMRGLSALLSAANKFKSIYPVTESWVATLTPNKQRNNGIGEELMKEKIEPIVVFSKPPPTPPVIGPLVLFSLFEAWSSRDKDD